MLENKLLSSFAAVIVMWTDFDLTLFTPIWISEEGIKAIIGKPKS